VSYYTAMTDPDCDVALWASLGRDAGSQHTRLWLLDAWANGRNENGMGMYVGHQPWARRADGKFDLDRPNGVYDDRLEETLQAFTSRGIHVVLSILELYTWSRGKSGLLWVPDRDGQPVRNNINGVRWGDPNDDDGGYFMLPDEVLLNLMARAVDVAKGYGNQVSFELGNEMPEKDLHRRLRDGLRALGWGGRIQVNRNEDTPSQFWNMGLDRVEYHGIAFHGMRDIGYLDKDYGPDQHIVRTLQRRKAKSTSPPARWRDGTGSSDLDISSRHTGLEDR
jgi:hypothetical protein